jgi:hypothetical protein
MENELNTGVFWLDGFEGNAKGGFFLRSFDLNNFIKKVEESENGGKLVGLKFEGNNVELIVEEKNIKQNKDQKRLPI